MTHSRPTNRPIENAYGHDVPFGDAAKIWVRIALLSFVIRFQIPVWATVDIASVVLAIGAMTAMRRFHVGMIPVIGVVRRSVSLISCCSA